MNDLYMVSVYCRNSNPDDDPDDYTEIVGWTESMAGSLSLKHMTGAIFSYGAGYWFYMIAEPQPFPPPKYDNEVPVRETP